MKSIFKYIISLSVITGIVSCAFKEDQILPNNNDYSTVVVASVENFSKHNVSTKATSTEEKAIDEIAMLVFGANDEGKMVLVADPLCVEGNNSNFVINLGEDERFINHMRYQDPKEIKEFSGETCRVYLVANMNTYLTGLTSGIEDDPETDVNESLPTTEEKFLQIAYTLPEPPEIGAGESFVEMPTGGFPMIGYKDVSLSGSQQQTTTISMKKMFAKIRVRFRVQVEGKDNPDDMSMPSIPYFAPGKWKVYNIPNKVCLNTATVAEETEFFNTLEFEKYTYGNTSAAVNRRIQHSRSEDEYFEFSFYVPENRVEPANVPYTYPDKIDDNSKQFYKPMLCSDDQYPTYVEITGKFSDYQGHISDVKYKLYLGQNEYDDFQVIRNQELYNELLIKGLTNHADGIGDISVDHRVNITSSGYSIAMERETLLDSHFELRPMDISVEGGGTVRVVVPARYTWFRAERSDAYLTATDQSVYDMTTDDNGNLKAAGLRKYFTTDLISKLGTPGQDQVFEFTAPNGVGVANFRLWFYFDESTNLEKAYNYNESTSATNELFREGKVDVYYIDGEDPNKNQQREFKFRQMNLWAINADINDYYIEYFEEYLYNYAADDHFGVTHDGMAWGLENINKSLSTKYEAIYLNKDNMGGWLENLAQAVGASFQSYFNTALKGVAYYDFYLSRDNVPKSRDYAGIHFTEEIVKQAGIDNNDLTLSGNAKSAVEYCYNKNKRNPNTGKVDKIHWYLPAIDETEDVLVEGFDYFDVFQSKYYWSSQPSYHKYDFTASGVWGTTKANGSFYEENISNARATIVTVSEHSADSGVDGAKGIYENVTIENSNTANMGNVIPSEETTHAGNMPRSTPNRVRCLYSESPLPHIYGDYNIVITTGNTTVNVPVTICNVNNNEIVDGEINIKLTNYFHQSFQALDYPQFAYYDRETSTLSIKMDQQVGTKTKWALFIPYQDKIYSRLYNTNNQAVNANLEFKYDKTTHNFSVVGNNKIGTDDGDTIYQIVSFERVN